MKLFTLNFILLVCLLSFAQNANAQATLSVQGSLQNFNGSAVDNGQYDITFRLYTTDAGGTAIWSETQTVPLIGGVYSVLLGAVNPLNIPFDQPYFLGLTIPGGPEHTPRTRLTASPYALSMLGQDNKFPSTGLVQMGAVATGTDITTATSYTVADNDQVIYLDHTANQNVTLPAATTANTGRKLMLVNKAGVAKTLTSSNYVDLAGGTSTTVPATGVVELQSDGSVWRQTGGYVQPPSVGRAFVRCNVVANPNSTQNIPGNTTTVVPYTEISDAQNCWNTATHTFTAPRTGIYRISGVVTMYTTTSPGLGFLAINDLSQVISNFYSHDTGWYILPFSIDYPMTAGQTFQIKYQGQFPSAINYPPYGSNPQHLTILEQ